MMKLAYDHQAIERRWRQVWSKTKLYQTDLASTKPKFYCLDMFPYTSGDGLHVGHWRGYVLSDFYARYWRLKGKNVFHPMGFDSFGLPAENAAIKYQSHPSVFTTQAISRFTDQLQQLGASFDWSKSLATSDQRYYRWTQWLFLQFFKHKLAEKRLSAVNWCPNDQTVLANEQVAVGRCERCGAVVTKKELSQWFLKTTAFAEELLEGLEEVNWPERVKTLQRNWIGRSVGAEVKFIAGKRLIKVFTTRLETIFGVNALVLAPEYPELDQFVTAENRSTLRQYLQQAQSKTNVDREQAELTEKSAVFTGSYATHPLTHKKVPIWVADYVLPTYGSGAVMSVPAHDERDYLFSRTYHLPVYQVIKPAFSAPLPYLGEGQLINSGRFNGLSSPEARQLLLNELEKTGVAVRKTVYRLRDWLVSRQRYWGAPIPIVYDPNGVPYPVKEEHLPLSLPNDVDFRPGGESPLTRSREYRAQATKLYGRGWQFETDTLDTFVDSSWYFLRYLSAQDDTQAFNRRIVEQWLPVDLYIGGIEHATLHLLYARFVMRFLAKYGYVKSTLREPFAQLYNIASITYQGAKMSKSKGNVVSPDELIAFYGTDALRGYELFIGPVEVEAEWSSRGINGVYRFLVKLFNLGNQVAAQPETTAADQLKNRFQQYLSAINLMIEDFRLNTVIAEAMKLVNDLGRQVIPRSIFEPLVITLAPIFPYLAEELWARLGHRDSIFNQSWPVIDQATLPGSSTLSVRRNHRHLGSLTVTGEESQDEAIAKLKASPLWTKHFAGQSVEGIFYQPGQFLDFVLEKASSSQKRRKEVK